MRSMYEPLGKFIRYIDERNIGIVTEDLQGISIDKFFMPSVGNVIGTDLSKYKLLRKGRFACNPMHVGRDERLPVSFYDKDEPAIVSPAYFMFEIIDNSLLDSEYLMLCFRRADFDHKCWFRTDGSVRGGLSWDDLCSITIPIPSISEQRRIVYVNNVICKRMALLNELNQNLFQQAQNVFLHIFKDNDSVKPATIADISLNVTDGMHNTVIDDPNGQYYLLSCKNIKGGSLNIGTSERKINKETFEKLRRRTKLAKGDVLISSVGTVGEILILNTEPTNYEFQRSVAIIKPNTDLISSYYLFEALTTQKAELVNAAHGAVQQCLFISDIASFPIGIPSIDDLRRFDNIVKPMFEAINENEIELKRLEELRDVLLPRLMSGKPHVSNY